MSKIIITLFLIVNSQLVNSQIFIGQLCLSTIDSLPTYHCASSDTSRMNYAFSSGPLRIPNKLNLLYSNSFFVRVKSTVFDSTYSTKLSQLDELDSLKTTPFNEKNTKRQKWKLISIQDYGNYNPCCDPPYQVNNIFYLESKNLIFSSDKLLQSFNTDNINWVFSNRGDRYLTVTYSFSYIMNDSAEGGTIYIFELSEGY